ncbi:hypothetical protein GCM10022409_46820 [Hymenobacter glaciei]|uniref:Resolvase HTH domain-containing protein n=1 Tax=Hymenobacter glaciei TaxID=877209 RepID=A0ABP7UW62_9BACT
MLASLPKPAGASGGRYAAKVGQEAKVRELHAAGLSYRAIAEQTGVPFRTVGNWLTSG